MNSKSLFTLIVILILLSACGTLKSPYYDSTVQGWESRQSTSGKPVVHTLYLLGDAGEIDNEDNRQNYVLNAANIELQKENKESTLVFLGDNIYPSGLPNKEDPTRAISEEKLNIQIELARNFKGDTYFIPGNHDWNHYDAGGRKAIKRQEDYIQEYFGKDGPKVKHFPNNACADPKVIKIHKDLVFVFLDSQWWLQDWSKEKKMNRGCEIKTRGDFLKTVEEIFTEHKNDEIVVLMHHPIKSNGLHGGNFNLAHHIFPLHEKNIWFPLPIIGSIYPIYRQVTGSKQDITNVHNIEVVGGVESIAKRLGVNAIFAAGHEHGLQYFNGNKLKYIVSGGGSKQTYTKKGGEAEYARDGRGYARIQFHEDNEAWIEFFTVAGFGQMPKLEYRAQLREARAGTVPEPIDYPSITAKSRIVAAGEEFAASNFKKKLFGEQYRDIWTTPIEADIIDLSKEKGGLTPVKKGGGMASNSLRMQVESGKQYNLRSIRKDYTKLVPDGFDNLKLLDLLKDQNSAGHPYGPLIIPTLSKAAGVYYTDPKVVFLQHQKGLGNYNSQFNEELYLLEERPNGDWSDAAQFGNSKEIIGYVDLLDRLNQKKNHFVDQHWTLKSRMFDLFIHDWDRHDDQWRWASFTEGNQTIYRPIPRDRDQAFYKFRGLVPGYVAAFMQRKFKTIKENVRDVKYLSFNARNFDRYFLNDLDWSDWKSIIKKLQEDITEADIEKSMTFFPKETLSLDEDEELTRLLKARRLNLMDIGRRYYEFLAKEVEISGSDDKEQFEITRNDDGSVQVQVFVQRDKKDDLLKYDRTFIPSETKEIRLFGLRGKDDFKINGSDKSSIKIRIIGGEDKDEIKNKTNGSHILAYDNLDGIKIEGKVKDKRSHHIDVNEYDRTGYRYNTSLPFIFLGSTVDDGFWIGGSMAWTNHAWRKHPYKSKQSILFRMAPGSQDAYRLNYNGHFTDVIDHIDFAPAVSVDFPRYENFFGLGNESINTDREKEFNWVTLQSYSIEPMFRLNFGSRSHFSFGPLLQSHKIKNVSDRVSDDTQLGFTSDKFDRRTYLGVQLDQSIAFIDNETFPTNGLRLNVNYTYLNESDKKETVSQFSTDLQFYIQLSTNPKLVLANNVGYQKSSGDLQFHQYADLGNLTNLRGFRNNRFRGEQAFFHNVDLRMHLFKWRNNILPMDVGIVGGYDSGRVWLDSENSDQWHNSTTIGLWMDVLGAAILQPYYSFNDDGDSFSLRLGFSF